ncbi:MAG: Asp23/Gls24 family envelope stress response protein [Bacillota bacterium]|nr:Asp23/Gls24 family envelope stress response protein [Bacillota bacterium]
MGENSNVENTDSVKISEEVIAIITGVAASDIEGVSNVGNSGIAANWTEIIAGKKNNSKGIKIELNEEKVIIDINITVNYGTCIPDVARNVQDAVKKSVEEMTGLVVEKVNVRVAGIKLKTENDKKPSKTKKEEQEAE